MILEKKLSPAAISMLIALALLCGASLLLCSFPVWITDNGNKYIIMRNFAENGSLVIRHAVPELFPDGGFHFQKIAGEWRSFYPEIFPVFSSFFYRLAGNRGAVIPVLLAGVLLAGVMGRYFKSYKISLLALLATPCFYYSLLLWEMIPAVLFCTLGVIFLARKRSVSGGILLAAGLFFREEIYFAAAAAGLALLWEKDWKNILRFSAGFLPVMLLVFLEQFLLTGHILGVHGATYYLNNRTGNFVLQNELLGALWNYYHHLLRFDASIFFTASGIVMLLLGAFRSTPVFRRVKTAFLLVQCGFFLYGAYWFCQQQELCFAATVSAGFITTLPIVWGFFLNWNELLHAPLARKRFWTKWILIYTLLVPVLLTRSDIGLFWGARHFLFVMPFAVFLGCGTVRKMLWGRRLLLPLAVYLSLVWQLCGLSALNDVSRESAAFTRSVLEAAPAGTAVASDLFYLPEQTPELFFERTFCKAATEEEIEKLCRYIREQGKNELVFITGKKYSRLTPGAGKKLQQLTAIDRAVAFESNVSGFMDLIIFNLKLKGNAVK